MKGFTNLNYIKKIEYIKKSDYYKQVYNSDKILVCHDFNQVEKDFPRTSGLSHFNNIEELLENICQTNSKMYNVLNMIPQQTNILLLTQSHKYFQNRILNTKENRFYIDDKKVTKTLTGRMIKISKKGFIIDSSRNVFLFNKVTSYHDKNDIKIETIYYISI